MESSRWGSLSSCVQQQQLWSQRQPEIREADDCSSLGGNVDLVDNLFNSGHDIQGHKSSNLASDFGSANGIIQELAPAIDSINVENLNLFQRQEAMRLAKSGAGSGTTWGKALTGGELCSPLINRLYSNTPLSSLMPGMDKLQVPTTGMQVDTLGVSADSLESLDCLLSASNSNTDTSVEDDGISMLFSECKSIWNFNSSGAISSGESENNGKASKPEENVSKSYTNPSDTRPSSSKRAKEREEVKTSVNYRHFDIFQSDSSTTEGGFKLISDENPSKLKKPRLEKQQKTSNINFQQPNSSISSSIDEPDTEAIAHVKEMIYRAAVFRPVSLDLDVVEKPKRKNVKISSDPQTVAARQRRERISERIRILQRLVPGGNKMDTASMLDEAANYLKFLRSQIKALEAVGHNKFDSMNTTTNLPYPSFPFNIQNFPMQPFFPFSKP